MNSFEKLTSFMQENNMPVLPDELHKRWISYYIDFLCSDHIVDNNITEEFIIKNISFFQNDQLSRLSQVKVLSENLFQFFIDEGFSIKHMKYCAFSDDFIIKNIDHLYMSRLIDSQELSEKVIDNIIGSHNMKSRYDYLNLVHLICRRQKLSERLIAKYCDSVDWVYISRYQKLSVDFAKRYKQYICWRSVSLNKQCAAELIKHFGKEFICDIDWRAVSQYANIDDEFIDLFGKYLLWDKLAINENLELSETKYLEYQHLL